MTVAPAVTTTVYTLTGSTLGPFNTGFGYEQDSDLAVLLDLANAAPIATLDSDADYGISDDAPTVTNGGTITLSSSLLPSGGWPTGARLIIQRGTQTGQPSAFGEQSGFSPATSEQALDHLARQIEDLSAGVAGAISLGPGEAPAPLGTPSQRANAVVGFDAEGDLALLTSSDFKGDPGAPGGFAVGVTSAIGAITIPAGLNFFSTSGYFTDGDGGGADWGYIAALSTNSHGTTVPTGLQITDAAGRHFQMVPRGGAISANAFGLMQDCVLNASGQVVSGTDDWQAIQNAIDAAIYVLKCECIITRAGVTGISKITQTLSIGYGVGGSQGGVFRGVGGIEYGGSTAFPGVAIAYSFSDRPAFNIQGGRHVTVSGLTVMGPFAAYMIAHSHGLVGVDPAVDDRVLANWIDPALSANSLARYTPAAAFAIDGYSGTAPGTPYANLTYPTWAANRLNGGTAIPQYGHGGTAVCHLDDLYIWGAAVAVAIQPANYDGNGDGITLTNFDVEYCAIQVSAGNTQGRTMSVDKWYVGICHTGFTNNKHGFQEGHFGGVISNYTGGACIQLFDVNGYFGPVTFLNCYMEQAWMLGTSSGAQIALQSCQFSFDNNQANSRGVPRAIIAGQGAANNISIRDSIFGDYYAVAVFEGLASFYEVENIEMGVIARQPTLPYQYLVQNLLAGGICFDISSTNIRPARFSAINPQTFDCLTGAGLGNSKIGETHNCQRNQPLCAWSSRGRFYQQPAGPSVDAPPLTNQYNKTSFPSATLVGTTLTLPLATLIGAGYNANLMNLRGLSPGDLLISDEGTRFAIKRNDGTNVVAEQLNNFSGGSGSFGSGTGATPITAINLSSGSWLAVISRVFLPRYFTQATLSTSSLTLSAAGNPSGFSYLATDVLAGDAIYIDPATDPWLTAANQPITATTSNTIVVTGDPAYAAVNKPVGWVLEAPPANV